MSTTPQPVASATPTPPNDPAEVRVYSHSNIYYWWPVWAVGFILGLWTWFGDGHFMVTVPPGSELVHASKVEYELPTKGDEAEKAKAIKTRRDVDMIVSPEASDKVKNNKDFPRVNEKDEQPMEPKLHMAKNTRLGVIFCTVLLLVITITNVPLRGMWSILVIITIALLAVIFALLGWWEKIVTTLSLLDIRINAGGYFFLSTVLFIIWALAVFLFDRQTYIIFTPGQFKVCQSIGDGEKVYDTVGLNLSGSGATSSATSSSASAPAT